MSKDKDRERAFVENARRELGAWPTGPASGFEPIGEIARRLVKKLAKANASAYNVSARSGADNTTPSLTDDAAKQEQRT